MNNYTMNAYEVKRDLMKFSEKTVKGLTKPEEKFIKDMTFGISKSGSTMISEISRSLDEDIELNYTIERLCDNLYKFNKVGIILNNYYKEVRKELSEDPVVLFDDSYITKIYGKNLKI